MNFQPSCFDELIGFKKTLTTWKEDYERLEEGDILCITGYSGVGKTVGTRMLVQERGDQCLWLDTSVCSDGKDIYDRILKFHNWMDLRETLRQGNNEYETRKVIVMDEIDSFLKLDRSVLGQVLQYKKRYKNKTIPIILIGHRDVFKKIGDIRDFITNHVSLGRLQDIDIFLYLKKRLPKNAIKLTELMKIAEDCKGNVYMAIQGLLSRIGKNKKLLLSHYVGDEQKTFEEVFECSNPNTIANLLMEDSWMYPLKIHENIGKVLDEKQYTMFLDGYMFYEYWDYQTRDSVLTDTNSPVHYLAHLILSLTEGKKGKMENMEFSKLLSYISTQKKYKKMVFEKVPPQYPLEDVGSTLLEFVKNGKC